MKKVTFSYKQLTALSDQAAKALAEGRESDDLGRNPHQTIVYASMLYDIKELMSLDLVIDDLETKLSPVKSLDELPQI